MNRRWLVILLGVLGLFMLYEILNNSFSLFMLVIGVLALVFRHYLAKKNQNLLLIAGIGAVLLALFSNRIVLLILVVVFMLIIGEYPDLFKTIRQAISKKSDGKTNEFIMIDFTETKENPAKTVRNPWFGDDTKTADEIYSWNDVNFTKLMGDTIFDLGNTLLPKENNIILIRKGFGHTRILVPEEVAISLDISMLLGEITINQEDIVLRNETFKWQSERYSSNERKIKLVANVLVGEVEVVFL